MIHILQHIIVPKPQNSIATRFEILCPFFIVFPLLQVVAPVQLDDQFLARSAEVNYVIANRVLVPEMDIAHPVSA